MSPTVTGLFLYPVKGLRGFAVASMELDELGPVGDRRFLIVEESGRFLTQRSLPRMALVETALSADSLTLSARGAGAVSIARAPDSAAPVRTVSVWKHEGLLAEDCGDAAAAWLSDFLEKRCRLVRAGTNFVRAVTKPAAQPGDVFAFADAVPLLVISEATLADLNDRIVARGEEPVPMDRFRPNLVVGGCVASAEDTWPRFRAGEVAFRAAGPSIRCIVTTTDQQTGERGKEPLRTLASYRRAASDSADVLFGQNLIHETKRGTLRVGDAIAIL